jgi:hypothetical protein
MVAVPSGLHRPLQAAVPSTPPGEVPATVDGVAGRIGHQRHRCTRSQPIPVGNERITDIDALNAPIPGLRCRCTAT